MYKDFAAFFPRQAGVEGRLGQVSEYLIALAFLVWALGYALYDIPWLARYASTRKRRKLGLCAAPAWFCFAAALGPRWAGARCCNNTLQIDQ